MRSSGGRIDQPRLERLPRISVCGATHAKRQRKWNQIRNLNDFPYRRVPLKIQCKKGRMSPNGLGFRCDPSK